jgi:hypothetical protein
MRNEDIVASANSNFNRSQLESPHHAWFLDPLFHEAPQISSVESRHNKSTPSRGVFHRLLTPVPVPNSTNMVFTV